ncbi:MAG: hydroxymethylglutaryl-CoA lyase [Planctomycetes bacterium]|nr:hydroxymethylglutaryl-CoA lyase [Planctomycetota bacterium]MCP4771816.1 hydroxymethylglutaryl-CoA lyase [Planctomycetota bacterium]MCP4860939.1 hydroxymethylglutaryl-CoA lyase [Planctomycetota bacterium]
MTELLRLHEVAARDGLQNEKAVLPTARKLELLETLAASCPDSLEVTSFVRADLVPQLADAVELCAALKDVPWREGLPLVGLVLNMRGYESFHNSGLDAITAVIGANENFSKANSGMAIEKAAEVNRSLCAAAKADGYPVRMYLSMAFGSPSDGDTDPQVVLDLIAASAEMGVERVVLSDTVGVGRAEQVEALVSGAQKYLPLEKIALHMHDTYGTALENCAVAMDMGVRMFDASAGGTGGCPFAPGAAGNLATGSLLAYAASKGMAPDMDCAALDRAATLLSEELGRPLAMGGARRPA